MADPRPFRRNLFTGASVLILLVFGIVGLSIYNSYQGFVVRATSYVENLAEVMATNVAAEVRNMDLLLLAEADEASRELKQGAFDAPLLNDFLLRYQSRLAHGEFGVVDSAGLIRFLSYRPVDRAISVADRSYFRTLSTNPEAGLVVTVPETAKTDGKRVIHFARRITAPDGGFGGVVLARIATDDLAASLHLVGLGEDGVVSLWSASGQIVARHPELSREAGSPSATLQRILKAETERAVYRTRSGLDGIERQFAVRRVQGGLFYVVVGQSRREYLRSWWWEMFTWFGLAAAFAIGTVAAVRVIDRQWRDQTQVTTLLHTLSTQDALTGIANRRLFDAMLENEWCRAARNVRPLSLLMIDVDYFKAFNDRYGHQEGDRCLHAVATALRSALSRSSDMVARYGGEEFAVLLPETEIAAAGKLAERLRAAVADLAIPHESSEIGNVSISIGVACADTANASPALLIKAADRALYEAKSNGRNRAVLDLGMH